MINAPNSNYEDFIVQMKNNIILDLLENDKIIELIDSKEAKDKKDLIYKNIFPCIQYGFVTQQTEEVYIGIKIQLDSLIAESNNIYAKMVFTFNVLAHNNRMNQSGGTITDLIASEINKSFNHITKYGFEWNLIASDEGTYNNEYYERTLAFEAIAQNAIQNGWKINRVK